jgi:hypothetical protein
MSPIEHEEPVAQSPTESTGRKLVVPGLYWGVKRSFVAYIWRMPDGQAAVGRGARPLRNGDFFFEPRPSHAGSQVRFRGELRFAGHMGMLSVHMADPWIDLTGDRGELSIGSARDGGWPRIALASLTFDDPIEDGGLVLLRASRVHLSAPAVPLFNGVYPEGESLEPLTVVLPAAEIG